MRKVLRSLSNPEVAPLSPSSPLQEGFLLQLSRPETEQQHHFVLSRSLSVLHVKQWEFQYNLDFDTYGNKP